ncbi:hypothetical protein [Rhizobium sp. JAB6]|uniref:hypothetical protein n=1 Tax=Rhizobium sp. JAB6 TaxID=2127050 RepID=UPI001FE063F4|nr:hypothetical protein [Rhizobium sp. JAB6]
MTKSSFRQADLQRILKAAKAAGSTVQIDLRSLIVTVLPIAAPEIGWSRLATQVPDGKEDWSDVEEFDLSPTRSAEPEKGPSGYPIIDDKSHPLRRWYDRLGFDARTMGREDMNRLQKEAEDRWAASIPGTPLQKREVTALQQLAAHGPNVKVHWRDVKNCGPDTEDRLKARGFVETLPNEKFPDRIGFYMLTEAGYEAWKSKQ